MGRRMEASSRTATILRIKRQPESHKITDGFCGFQVAFFNASEHFFPLASGFFLHSSKERVRVACEASLIFLFPSRIPIFLGGHAGELLENPEKGAEGVKAGEGGHLVDTDLLLGENTLCIFDFLHL